MSNNPVVDKLDELIFKQVFNDKIIVLFGMNQASKQMKEYLESKGYSVAAIIDNDKRKCGQAPFGVMTYSPNDYLGQYSDKYIVLIVSQYHAEMVEQLNALGYLLNEQVFVVQKLFDKYDLSIETFNNKKKIIEVGEEIYFSIFEQYRMVLSKKEGQLFICPYPGNGDIYIIGQLLNQACFKININNIVFTMVGKGCASIGEMFGLKNIVVLNQAESDSLVSYARFVGQKETKTKILNDCYQQVVNRRLRGYHGINFANMFNKVVFNIQEDNLKFGKEKCAKEEIVSKYDSENGIVKGKTIILSPYANTIDTSNMVDWEKVVEQLNDKGFTVFTNCEKKEQVVSGSMQIFAPFSYMKQLVEYAGCFIGIRSGLCDVISSAKAKKIILYPKGILFGNCSTFDYFSLNSMGLCSDAIELEYEHNKIAHLLVEYF